MIICFIFLLHRVAQSMVFYIYATSFSTPLKRKLFCGVKVTNKLPLSRARRSQNLRASLWTSGLLRICLYCTGLSVNLLVLSHWITFHTPIWCISLYRGLVLFLSSFLTGSIVNFRHPWILDGALTSNIYIPFSSKLVASHLLRLASKLRKVKRIGQKLGKFGKDRNDRVICRNLTHLNDAHFQTEDSSRFLQIPSLLVVVWVIPEAPSANAH